MNEETLQLLFEGVDNGLSDLIQSLQGQLQGFLSLATGANFTQVSGGLDAASTSANTFSQSIGAATGQLAQYIPVNAAATAGTQAQAEATAAAAQRLGDYAPAAAAAKEQTKAHGDETQATAFKTGELRDRVQELGNDALPGLSQATSLATATHRQFKESLDEEVNTLAMVGGGAAALGVAVAGISFSSFENGVESLHKLALESGMTTAQVAGLQTTMQAAGVETDKSQMLVMIFSRNLETMQQQIDAGQEPTGRFVTALKDIGVNAVDSSGHVKSMGDLMPEIIAGFRGAKEAADAHNVAFHAAGLANDIFGRSGAQLVPLLLSEGNALADNTAKAAALGLGSDEQVKKLEAWHEAQAQLTLQMQAFGASVGSDVAPILTQASEIGQQFLDFINKLPPPLKDLVITAPLAAGGVLLIVAALSALIPVLLAATADAIAFFVAMQTNPIGWVIDGVALLIGGLILLKQHLDGGKASVDSFTKSLNDQTAANDAVISSLQKEGASHDQVRQITTDHYNAAVKGYNDAQAAMEAYQQKLMAEANGHAVNFSQIEKHDTTLQALDETFKKSSSNLQDWTAIADKQEQADKDSAQAQSELATQATKAAAALGLGSSAVEAHAAAQQKLKGVVDLALKSSQDFVEVQVNIQHAQDILAGKYGDVTKALTDLKTETDHGTDAQKAQGTAVTDVVTLLQNGYTPALIDAAIHQQDVNDELSKMKQPSTDTISALHDISQAFKDGTIDAEKFGQALMDALSKPTQAELQERQQIDAIQVSLSQWQATLANSSAVDQHIAALAKQVDQEARTGASVDQQKKVQEELRVALGDTTQAHGAYIVAQQQTADKLDSTLGAHQANLRVLQDQRTAAKDAADMNTQNYAPSLQAVLQAADPTAAGISRVDAQTKQLGTDALNTANDLVTLAGKMQGIAGMGIGLFGANVMSTGTGGLIGAVSAGTTGNVPQDIIAWAKQNAAALGADPQQLAAMELGLSNYESGWGNNPFQFMNGLAAQYGQSGSAGSQLDALAGTDDRVRRAYQAYIAAGGGLSGLHAAENIQEIPGEAAIQARGGDTGFAGSYAAAIAALGMPGGGAPTPINLGSNPTAAPDTTKKPSAADLPPTAGTAALDTQKADTQLQSLTDHFNTLEAQLGTIQGSTAIPELAAQAAAFNDKMAPIPALYADVAAKTAQYNADVESGTVSVKQLTDEHNALTAAQGKLTAAMTEADTASKAYTHDQTVLDAQATASSGLQIQLAAVTAGQITASKKDVTVALVQQDQQVAQSSQATATTALNSALAWHQKVVDDITQHVSPSQLAADQAAAANADKSAKAWYDYWHTAQSKFEADQTALHDAAVKAANELANDIQTALKAQYKEQYDTFTAEINQEKHDSAEASAKKIQTWTDETAAKVKELDIQTKKNEDALAQQHTAQIEAMDAATKAQLTALTEQQATQLAALYKLSGQTVSAQMAGESSSAASIRAEQESELQAKIAAATGDQKKQLQSQLYTMQEEDLTERFSLEAKNIQDTAALNKKAVDDKYTSDKQARAEALQTEKDDIASSLKDRVEQEKGYEKQRQDWLDRMLKSAKTNYDAETTTLALAQQTRLLLEDGHQKELLNLLQKYYPDWKTAGKTFGEQLIDGIQDAGAGNYLQSLLDAIRAPGLAAGTHAAATPGTPTTPGSAGLSELQGSPRPSEGRSAVSIGSVTVTVTNPTSDVDVQQAVQQGIANAFAEMAGRGAAMEGAA